ncbi:MAG TPA: NfeD family protein [Acidimicrobiales bacterium]|nr:NfeD family protein [Acidimicrobiales bacterium]
MSPIVDFRAVGGTVAKVGLALATAGATLLALGPPGGAQDRCDPGSGPVAVAEVDGLVDEVLADFVADQVTAAEEACGVALVLQLDSGGVTAGDATLDTLVADIEGSAVPVAVWIGPSGSRVTGEAVRLVAAAGVTGIAPGSSIEVTPALLDATGVEPTDLGDADVGDRVGAARAVELGLIDSDAPIIGEFVVALDGVETRVVGEGADRRTEPVTPVQFGALGITAQVMHTVASPAVAYLLFVIGLALLLFELFTAGVGVAGVVGAGSLILGCYGLAALPTRPVGVALLLFAIFGYGIDIQTGVPRVWTGIATASFVLGSLLLFDGLSVSWITLLLAFVGITLGMVAGMPTMVRSRFSTPTIGRDWMIGEMGTARTDIAPDGVVTLRDAPWRARTNRATPIRKQEAVRVVAIEGLVLEVEPEEGGAKDYRERARSEE